LFCFFSPSAELITHKKKTPFWIVDWVIFFLGWSLLLRRCIKESNMEL
jgi:hypothetical protein